MSAGKKVIVDIEITNSNILRFKCPEGHKYIVSLQTHRHHILFNYALSSYLTKNYHSAVSIAAVTIERAREFYINCKLNKISTDLNDDLIDEGFKEMWQRLNTTERQFGAFMSLYFMHEQSLPVDLDKVPSNKHNATNLRNRVVHNGYIPNSEECLSYLNVAFEYVKDIEFRANYPVQSHYEKNIWLNEQKRAAKMLSKESDVFFMVSGSDSVFTPIYNIDESGNIITRGNTYTLGSAIESAKRTIRIANLVKYLDE
jgi:hypothetical protein